MYRVKCKFERGIKRSGKHWPSTWTETDEVTQEMRDDPGLIIEDITTEPVMAIESEHADVFSDPFAVDEFVAEVEEPSAEVEPEAIIEATTPPLYVSDKDLDGKAPLPQRGKRR